MTKQDKKQEWRDKYKAELAPKFTPNDMADEKMTEIMTDIYVNTQADFFYSLHLQEIEKIREVIEKRKQYYKDKGWNPEWNLEVEDRTAELDYILLAITDEK